MNFESLAIRRGVCLAGIFIPIWFLTKSPGIHLLFLVLLIILFQAYSARDVAKIRRASLSFILLGLAFVGSGLLRIGRIFDSLFHQVSSSFFDEKLITGGLVLVLVTSVAWAVKDDMRLFSYHCDEPASSEPPT